MSQPLPTRQNIEAAAAAEDLVGLLDRVSRGESRVIVEQGGTSLAAIISPEDLERLDLVEANRQRDFAILAEIGALFGDASPGELDREGAEATNQVRPNRPANPDDVRSATADAAGIARGLPL